MKLYVWNDPFRISYGGSCLYVIAESEDAARAMAQSAGVSEFGHKPEGSIPIQIELGAPDRVHDLPHAECYTWAE